MKLKFKLLILFVAIVSIGTVRASEEQTKKFHNEFAKSDVDALSVINKYGSITINDAGGDKVTIDVTIIVKTDSKSKADDLFDDINIKVDKSGKKVFAETTFDQPFNTRLDFNINYQINIPADRALEITQKYGNVVLTKLTASGKFDIAYGGIKAQSLMAPAGSPILMELSYAKLSLEEINNLKIDSKYSGISIDKVNNLDVISKYDSYSLGNLGSMNCDSKYTGYRIEKLNKKLIIETGYGEVKVEEVMAGFEEINITSSYGGISLGLDKLAYKIDAECEYCAIAYPREKFEGNREKDNHNTRINGKIGNGTATVRISSSYGGIRLCE